MSPIIPAGSGAETFGDLDRLLGQFAGVAVTQPFYAHITPAERRLLEALRRAAPEQLPVMTMWLVLGEFGNWPVASASRSHSLYTHLYRLRQRLKTHRLPLVIRTVGYQRRTPEHCSRVAGYRLERISTAAEPAQQQEAA